MPVGTLTLLGVGPSTTGPAPFVDPMVDTANTLLVNHVTPAGFTWANVAGSGQLISSTNRLRGAASATACVARSSWTPPGQSYKARFKMTANDGTDGMRGGIRVGATGDGYYVKWSQGSSQVSIIKRVSASDTTIGGPYATTGTSDRYWEIEIVENSATDATLTVKLSTTLASFGLLGTVTGVNPTTDGLTSAGSVGVYNVAVAFSNTSRIQIGEVFAQ